MAYLRNSLLSPKSRGVAVIFTIAIIIASYSLFFYLQNTSLAVSRETTSPSAGKEAAESERTEFQSYGLCI
ncbi:MAG TPA: hypothetical protein VFJ51_05670 [Nitrososphaeraceae archaeon]|nr:hypothetical protein [Nitrososphaeraceae archaeon]